MSEYYDENAYDTSSGYIDGHEYDRNGYYNQYEYESYRGQYLEQDGYNHYHQSYPVCQENIIQPNSSRSAAAPATYYNGTEESIPSDEAYPPPPPPPKSVNRHDMQTGTLELLEKKNEQHYASAHSYSTIETPVPETITLNLDTTASVDSSEFARAYGFDFSYPEKGPTAFSNHSVHRSNQEIVHCANDEDHRSRNIIEPPALSASLKYYQSDQLHEKRHDNTDVMKTSQYCTPEDMEIEGNDEKSYEEHHQKYQYTTHVSKKYHSYTCPPHQPQTTHAVKRTEAIKQDNDYGGYGSVIRSTVEYSESGTKFIKEYDVLQPVQPPRRGGDRYSTSEGICPQYEEGHNETVGEVGKGRRHQAAYECASIYDEENPHIFVPGKGRGRSRGGIRKRIPAAENDNYNYDEEIPNMYSSERGRVRARRSIPPTDHDYVYGQEAPISAASGRSRVRETARGSVRKRIPAIGYKSRYDEETTCIAPGRGVQRHVPSSGYVDMYDEDSPHVAKRPKEGVQSESSIFQSDMENEQSKLLIESSGQDDIPSWGRPLSNRLIRNRRPKSNKASAKDHTNHDPIYGRLEQSELYAAKHPALAVNELFPGNKTLTIGDNFVDNCTKLLNRYFVGIIIPSHQDRMFYGVAHTEKLARYEACVAALKGLKMGCYFSLLDHITTEDARKSLEEMRKFRNTVPWELKTDDGEFLDVVSYAKHQFNQDVVNFEEPILISTNPNDSIYKAVAKIGVLSFMEIGTSAEEANRRLAWTIIKAAESKNFKSRVELVTSKRVCLTADTSWNVHDEILSLVQKTIIENTKHVPSNFLDFHDIAGILLLSGDFEDVKNYRVIAVSVGTNCIRKDSFKRDGSAVHDSNAIVLAIRALRLFLLEELNNPLKETSVLEPSKCEDYKFRLKEQYHLVLATNHVPLGSADAMVKSRTIFNDDGLVPDSELCKLQTLATDNEITCGCHVKYVPCDSSQSVEKHSIVSPSDKITMYNVAGINGALLSQIIEPIYIDTYSVPKMGNYYQSLSAISKSIHRRIKEKLKTDFPFPYTSYRPQIRPVSFLSDQGNHNPGKSNINRPEKICDYSGWMVCSPDQGVWEVIKKSSGLALSEIPENAISRRDFTSDHEYLFKKAEESKRIDASTRESQLSKKSLFRKYKNFCKTNAPSIPDSYFACKDLATNYHLVKSAVKKAFESSNLGSWPVKSLNTDCFQ